MVSFILGPAAKGRALQHEQSAASESAAFIGTRYRRPGLVAFVVNSDRAFVTHRAPWASALAAAGAEVVVFARDTGYRPVIEELGFEFRELDLGRENIGVRKALLAAIKFGAWVLRRRPKCVFLIQTAAYSLGWLSAPFLPRTTFIRVAGGVGRAMAGGGTRLSSRLARALIRAGARLRNVQTLFQVESDRSRFISDGLAASARSLVIPSTGIDIDTWSPGEKNSRDKESGHSGILTVAFVSRLYEEKGVREFVEAASILRSKGHRFVVVGEPDEGVSTSVSANELIEWQHEGIIEWWGHRDDMLDTFRAIDLLVFPSRHPEGTPRTLIEAAACGVPALVSAQPGCLAVVTDRLSGWVLNAPTTAGIVMALESLLTRPDVLVSAGKAARTTAVHQFSLEGVLPRVLALAGAIEIHSENSESTMQNETGSTPVAKESAA